MEVNVETAGWLHLTPERAEALILSEATRAMRVAMLEVHGEVVRRAPVRTGHLRRSITHRVERVGRTIVGAVGTDLDYGRFQEVGTGLYGPRNRRIVPVNSRFLRFPAGGSASTFGPGGGGRSGGSAGPGFRLSGQQRSGAAGAGASFVFARSVRGVMPRRYFRDSAIVVRPRVVATLRAAGPRIATLLVSRGRA